LESFSSQTQPIRVSNAGRTKRVRDVFHSRLVWLAAFSSYSLLGETVGWLYLVDKLDAPEFGEADERLALTLAGQLAVAYENARLYAEAREHAAELLVEVTERKQAEEEKERLLVSEKTARLEAEEAQRHSARLLIARKMRAPKPRPLID